MSWFTVGTESTQTSLNISLFLLSQPFANVTTMCTQQPTLTEKEQCRIFLHIYEKKKRKTEISPVQRYFGPLHWFGEPGWASPAMSLLGSRFSHQDLRIFRHSSLQILSSSARLDGECWWTAMFRSLQKCSVGFISPLRHWSSATLIFGSYFHLFLQGFFPAIAQFGCTGRSRKSSGRPNFFHLGILEATGLLGTLSAAETILSPQPDRCLVTILSLSALGSSFDLQVLTGSDCEL